MTMAFLQGFVSQGAFAVASTQANNTLTAAPKFWVGTQANYDAIVSKDTNTIYLIQA